VLQAQLDQLLVLEQQLIEAQVPHRAVRESDQPYAGELMAIGIRPAPKDQVQRYVSSLPLLR